MEDWVYKGGRESDRERKQESEEAASIVNWGARGFVIFRGTMCVGFISH